MWNGSTTEFTNFQTQAIRLLHEASRPNNLHIDGNTMAIVTNLNGIERENYVKHCSY